MESVENNEPPPPKDVGRRPGFAPIKPDYLDTEHERQLVTDYMPEAAAEELKATLANKRDSEGINDRPNKKRKITGRSKKRPIVKHTAVNEKLCPEMVLEQPCSWGAKCKYNHDFATYLTNKPPDIGEHCYVFDTFGKCHFGLTCRFAKSHTTEDGKNIKNEELVKKWEGKETVRNILSKDLQRVLWKKQYDFTKANNCWKKIESMVHNRQSNQKSADPVKCEGEQNTTETGSASMIENTSENSDAEVQIKQEGPSSDVAAEEDKMKMVRDPVALGDDLIRLRPEERKKVNFEGKTYLAPLTTVGNLPFRRICKRLGADITCGEMALTTNLLQGKASEWALLKRHPSEDLFGVQVCGSYPDTMTRCAQLLTENCDADFIDINCGCPIDLIFKKGEGSALMGRQGKLEQIVRSMTSIMDIPLTLKMRTGIFENRSTAHNLIPKLREWGLSAVTVHGRSREQRYTKLADWQYLQQCASVAAPMPFFGNGDVLSYQDYNTAMEIPGVTGVMVARGALIKPWVFTEIKEQRDWDISASERLDLLKDFVHYGLEHWGSDDQGISTTRRFLLEWLSFQHRYIPVGLLECLPQKIHDKPPYYFGRSDLETLLSSPSYTDWIKISEMLLGPVPEGFAFMPKHKANAYQ